MQKAFLLFTCWCMLAVSAQDKPTGRKITFSTITDITDKEVKYNKFNPKEGTAQDFQAKRWVSVTSDGYETMGTLKEVMEEMVKVSDESKEDPSTPGASENPKEPLNVDMFAEDPTTRPSEGENFDENIDENNESNEDSDDTLTTMEDLLKETHVVRKRKVGIIGDDDRIRVSDYYLERFPWRTMGRVEIGCTGTFIRGRTILTAGHCVHQGNNRGDGWYHKLQLRRAKDCDPNKGYYYNWKRAVTYLGWYRYAYQYYDIAVIITYNYYGNWMAFGYHEPMPRYIVNINGYPGDKAGQCMWHVHCQITSTFSNGRMLKYPCDSAGGMSGSAVYAYFTNGARIIYGVHAYAYSRGRISLYNGGPRITRSVFNHLRSWISVYGGH